MHPRPDPNSHSSRSGPAARPIDPDAETDLRNHPEGAVTSFRRKIEFWNEGGARLEPGRPELEGARLIINGAKVDLRKQEGRAPNRGDISSSSSVKTFDDNNNSTKYRIGKRDGYAEFVKRLSLDRQIFSDDEVDFAIEHDLGRAVASQLWSSDSDESVEDVLVENLKKELQQFSGGQTEPVVTLEEHQHPSKTAPIVENQEKKKVGGIRRLLSPGIFSGEHRKKSTDQGNSRTSTPVQDNDKQKAVLETAFVGEGKRLSSRSKSLSPSRTTSNVRALNDRQQELRSAGYGVPKTNVNRSKENGTRHCCDNGGPHNGADANRNVPVDRPLQVDTSNNRRDSVASSTSSSSTLVSQQNVTPPWVHEVNKNMNNVHVKSMSLPGYRNPPHAQPAVQRTQIPVNRSGRVSAPPYIDCCSPYGQINQDRLLMPVAAQLKITPGQKKTTQKTSPVSQQLRGLLSPQGVRPRGYDPYYYNQNQNNHSSSVESSPGSQNSPKELRTFNPDVPNLVKPQPIYNSSPQRRPRSVSPATGRAGSLPPDYFVRGSTQRNTFSGGRPAPRQSTIYEEIPEEGKEPKKDSNLTYGPPIFKRGTLLSSTSSEGDLNSSAGKRVSFSPSHEQDINSGEIYWPTRKGLAPQPPTRQSSSDQTDYVNVSDLRRVPQAPDRPLPPIPRRTTPKLNSEYGVVGRQRAPNTPTTQRVQALASRWQHSPGAAREVQPPANRWHYQSDTESGSEAGEVQRIMQRADATYQSEEEWTADGKSGRAASNAEAGNGTGGREEEGRRGGRNRRDDPRRHTLSGEHHHNYPTLARSMDLETPLPRGYPPPSSAMLFDDDPGIMSEVETSSTGFRRGGKQRSSLPVVRTPSKTLERPLGLVFLQYRSETKRALLPNEITSIDTVKALFVRSFPKQLTMEYLDSPLVKIYIHDSSKDMFYELEDLRSHLRDIRDRSVLRLFESADVGGGAMPPGIVPPQTWDQDQSYFSEPEFDSEYQHQHIHKTKGSKGGPYYMTHSFPPGASAATLPRSGAAAVLRAYSPAVAPGPKPSSDGYMSSPERGGGAPPRPYPAGYTPTPYEDPYYSQYTPRTGSITPVIDEEARIRVEHMERQLANLTGLVQKALTQAPTPSPREFLSVPPAATNNYRNGNFYRSFRPYHVAPFL